MDLTVTASSAHRPGSSDSANSKMNQGHSWKRRKLVAGSPITAFCDAHRLPIKERLQLFIQICHGIQHAHQKGIIHRDIKPSNILVAEVAETSEDRNFSQVPLPKVIDFGIAKATQMELTEKTLFTELNQFVGTPAYMSPEQMEMSGADVDTRSDIYSLGVLLYELLTGSTPLDTTRLSYDEVRQQVREAYPPKPSTRLRSLQADNRTLAGCSWNFPLKRPGSAARA